MRRSVRRQHRPKIIEKQPYAVAIADESLIVQGGSLESQERKTTSLPPNAVAGALHDRISVILAPTLG